MPRLAPLPWITPALALPLALLGCGGEAEDDAHQHEHTPHHGVVAPLLTADGAPAGHVELKLHDDKGDLECWLAKDPKMLRPFALPLDQTVAVRFPALEREVTLRVRNADGNEDEDGVSTVSEGKTHYFIYPTQDGQDASWLQGEDFSSACLISLEVAGAEYSTAEFTLVPHTHEDGHEH